MARRLNIEIAIDSRKAKAGGKEAERALDGVRGRASSTSGSLGQMKVALAALGSAAALAGIYRLSRAFIEASSEAEGYAVRLRVLLGSTEEGARAFEEMRSFASRVPFEFREIMGAATTLAGVLRGGVDEISAWMPLIGDLAATTGLSIQDTTSQVIRMLSAGAASADLFRERGVLAMLGFQAGVSYSADETRDKLIESWGDVSSQFRGATDELANTWQGAMSMLSDAWFNFRVTVMDQGLSDELTSMANQLTDLANDPSVQEFAIDFGTAIANMVGAIGAFLGAWGEIKAAIFQGTADMLTGMDSFIDGFVGTWKYAQAIVMEFRNETVATLQDWRDRIVGYQVDVMSKLAVAGAAIAKFGPPGAREAGAAAANVFGAAAAQLKEDLAAQKAALDEWVANARKAAADLKRESLVTNQVDLDIWIEALEDAAQGALKAGSASVRGGAGVKTLQEMLDAMRGSATGAAEGLAKVETGAERLKRLGIEKLDVFGLARNQAAADNRVADELEAQEKIKKMYRDFFDWYDGEQQAASDAQVRAWGQEALEKLKAEWEEGAPWREMAEDLEAVSARAWENIQDIAADAIGEIVRTGKVDFDSLADSFLNIISNMLAEMLVQWSVHLAKKVAMNNAANAKIASSNAAASATGTGGGASALGGGGGGMGSAASSMGVWAVAAAAIWAVGYSQGWWGGGVAKESQGTFGNAPGQPGVAAYSASGDEANLIAEKFRNAIEIIGNAVKDLGLDIERFGDVTLQKKGKFYDITYLKGVEDTVQGVSEAVAVLAIKGAEFGDGISDFVAAFIQGVTEFNMAALEADVAFARMVEGFGKTDFEQEFAGLGAEMDAIFEKIVSQLRKNVEQMGVGLQATVQEELSRWQQGFRELTGVELSKEERLEMLRAQATVFEAEKALRIADLKARKMLIEEEIALERMKIRMGLDTLVARREILKGDMGLTKARINLGKSYLTGRKELLETFGKITKTEIDIRKQATNATIQILEVQLEALDALIAGLEAIPKINIPDLRLPGTGAGGGGPTQSDRDAAVRGMQDFGLSDAARQLAAATRFVEEHVRTVEDLGFSEQELMEIRKQAQAEQDKMIRDIGRGALAALGSTTVATVQRLQDLGIQLTFLRENFEQLGLKMWQVNQAAVELSKELTLSIANSLMQYVDDADTRRQLQILEHQLFMQQKNLEIQAARTMGLITQQQLEFLMGILDMAGEWEPPEVETQTFRRTVTRTFSDARRDAERMAESVARAKGDLADFLNRVLVGEFGGVSPVGGVLEAQRQYDEVLRQAQSGNIGAISELGDFGATLLRQAREAYASGPEFQAIRDYVLATGADILSLKQGREGNVVFDERFFSQGQQQISEQQRMNQTLAKIEQHLARRSGGAIVTGGVGA